MTVLCRLGMPKTKKAASWDFLGQAYFIVVFNMKNALIAIPYKSISYLKRQDQFSFDAMQKQQDLTCLPFNAFVSVVEIRPHS